MVWVRVSVCSGFWGTEKQSHLIYALLVCGSSQGGFPGTPVRASRAQGVAQPQVLSPAVPLVPACGHGHGTWRGSSGSCALSSCLGQKIRSGFPPSVVLPSQNTEIVLGE